MKSNQWVNLVILVAMAGCSKTSVPSGESTLTASNQSHIPTVTAPALPQGKIPDGGAITVALANGANIEVRNHGGNLYYEAEGTLSQESFSALMSRNAERTAEERNAVIAGEVEKIFSKIRTAHGLAIEQIPQVGYFSFLIPYRENEDLMGALKSLRFDHAVYFSPIIFDRDSLRLAKKVKPAATKAQISLRSGTENYSGLKSIHADEFVRIAEKDIGRGTKVNGSSVRVGITDTGITLNHPTFFANGKNRIDYMKDFTREGRVYFNKDATLTVTASDKGDDYLFVTGQVIVTPKLPGLPRADVFGELEKLEIKVSPDLRRTLLNPNSGAKLGVFLESTLQSDDEQVDINRNGKLDDTLPIIFIPGVTPEDDVAYFDFQGDSDFSNIRPVGHWNKTKESVKVFAETIGFDFNLDKLPKNDGSGLMEVHSLSIVGFDPGNHGSHVAGIAAGTQTLQNDSANTLARGVAPQAQVMMSRVCSNNMGCAATKAFIDLAMNANAQVINMSLGGLNPFNDGYGVEETIINRLTSVKNVIFMISAGNSGPGRQTVGSPSVARLSLSIGATATKAMVQRQYQWTGEGSTQDDPNADFMLFFSSRGPTAAGGFKPNISAPGTELSSVQLNAAPGSNAGLDVYWGTSMSAPTATGAFALLLDAIHKYNATHPNQKLTTDALVLRNVLVETARPFDAFRFDPQTGKTSVGQYTWIDQGTGMLDLVAAWKMLFRLRDTALPTAITHQGNPVELDYEALAINKGPNNIAYDGSRVAAGTAQFATGLFLSNDSTDTFRQIAILRKLPEKLSLGSDAGDLTRMLETTRDEFALRTVIYGSHENWIKPGVMDSLNCWNAEASDLTVLGQGSTVKITDKAGKKGEKDGTLILAGASTLNVCINRDVIANLPNGDHGALIYAYRKVGDKVSPVPSFVIPVFLSVPHKVLTNSTAYDISGEVKSFGVSRNYVTVPKGTTLVRVTLEVPALKTKSNGLLEKGETCSGVELMAYEGQNNIRPFRSRAEARISNCKSNGSAVLDPANRKLVITRTDPNPGIWDIHVFGSYKFPSSNFKMRVDYVASTMSKEEIKGTTAALNGSVSLKVKESSLEVLPDSSKSSLSVFGLFNKVTAKADKDKPVTIEGPLGNARIYPAETQSVEITTGGSPGNDIDLFVYECAMEDGSVKCAPLSRSTGAADDEKVTFKPKAGKAYIVNVEGYAIEGSGEFTSTETINLKGEKGTINVRGSAPDFEIEYSMTDEQFTASKLFSSELFTSSKYSVVGALTIATGDEAVLGQLPVSISKAQ